jgi:hypothetical protein
MFDEMTLLENIIVTILCLDVVRECLAIRACRALQDSVDRNHLSNGITFLRQWMILIDSELVISISLGLILHSASPGRKVNGVTVLGWCIILNGSKFEISSSLGLIRCNASPVRKADGITFLS